MQSPPAPNGPVEGVKEEERSEARSVARGQGRTLGLEGGRASLHLDFACRVQGIYFFPITHMSKMDFFSSRLKELMTAQAETLRLQNAPFNYDEVSKLVQKAAEEAAELDRISDS